MMSLVDQEILHRIRERVDHFCDDVFVVNQLDNRRLLGRPHRFPAPTQGVLMFRDQLVKIREKFGQVPVHIDDAGVVMIRHRRCEHDLNATNGRSQGEAI